MRVVCAALLVLSLWLAPRARAHVDFAQTALTPGEEVPAPSGVPAGAGGNAILMFDAETRVVTYSITVQNLSGAPIAGHIHQAPPGTAGGIVVTLPSIPAAATGSASGTATLPSAGDVQALYNEGLYVNVHTAANMGGEIRGQIRPVKGSCSCKSAAKHKKFVSCVKKAVKGLDKEEKQEAGIKALKRSIGPSSCGKKAPKKLPKNTIACCLPATPQNNIVTGRLCAQVSQSKCNSFLGADSGSSCFPSPCQPPASPSGAFVH